MGSFRRILSCIRFRCVGLYFAPIPVLSLRFLALSSWGRFLVAILFLRVWRWLYGRCRLLVLLPLLYVCSVVFSGIWLSCFGLHSVPTSFLALLFWCWRFCAHPRCDFLDAVVPEISHRASLLVVFAIPFRFSACSCCAFLALVCPAFGTGFIRSAGAC